MTSTDRSLIVLLLLLSLSKLSLTFQLSPSTLPEDVVKYQLEALQKDDMNAVYLVASPANKERTGDAAKFGSMVRSGPYRHLVQHAKSDIMMESKLTPASQQYLVRVITPDTRRVVEYWWSLSRCSGGEFDGVYMVDAVIPCL
mmetsp:Transcript_20171/g.29942  ORF Transcript_20171/g.29942 Transcript_20171/m.29942 type:complete len:143 (-) Transcript_20171:220-648(-)